MPFEPDELFGEFLAALADPSAGERLYRLYAPDAILRCSEGIRRCTEIDPVDFADTHHEVVREGLDALPDFAHATLSSKSDDAGKGEAVCWFDLTELRQQQRVTAAVGIRAMAGQVRIGWATLTTQVRNWSYADGYLYSLADYAWMRVSKPTRPRALIDASYFRQYWRPQITFSSLPDARFACQMSTVCCKHDFEISLPAEAQLLIDAMPWRTLRPDLAGTRLTRRPDGKIQLKSLNETCRFLGSRGQCLIHQTLGRQPFGPCCVFPIAFAETPEGIAVASSPICDSVRRGIGPTLLEQQDDLRERLVHAEPRQPDGFRLAPRVEISWENFRDVEKALCEILGSDDLPMRRRLYLASRLLAALRDKHTVEIEQWLAEPMVTITAELRQAIHGMLGKVLRWDRAALTALPASIPAELYGKEIQEQQIMARILRNTLFCKTYSYPFDLTTAHNFLIVLYLLALIMQEATQTPLPEHLWRELGSLGVHGLLKSVLHEGVPVEFRDVFGTAEFGMWMLSA